MSDVLVIGGGNAALCAALMAREAGAACCCSKPRRAPGAAATRMHTRNLRCMHDAPQDVLVEAYPEEEFWQDLLKVTGGLTDEALARLVIRASSPAATGCAATACTSSRSLSGALHLARTNAFFMGGGKALVNAYYRSAQALGVQIRYDAPVERSNCRTAASSPRCRGASASRPAACVLASGGFESNRDWLREAWGRNERGEWPADNFLIRGTRFNQGVLLKAPARRRRRPHRRPDAGAHGGHRRARAAVRRRHLHARRLRLAGHGGQPRRRALLRRGRGLLAQALRHLGPAGGAAAGPGRHSIIDAKAVGRFMPPVFRARRPTPCRSWRASWA
jgi:tricarballylate dehydrogenase